MDQGSKEWFEARLGRITASRIGDVMAKLKSGKPAATRSNYVAEKVAEILTGEVSESYTSPAMAWGTETEPQARLAYELFLGKDVKEVGFIPHPDIEQAGASPDGLVGDEGLIEIKCPNTATHICTLRGGSIDRKYLLQMQWQMACTGRKWCDFVSYDPRLPDELSLFVVRVQRTDEVIKEIESEVREIIEEINGIVKELKGL